MRVAGDSAFNTGIKSNFRKVSISINVEGITDPFTQADIKYFKIDSKDIPGRTFGVSYCHQFKIIFANSITIDKGDGIKVSFTCNGDTVSYPTFYADEIQKNKVTGETTVIGYDLMVKANDIKYVPVAGDIDDIADGVASQLGTTVLWLGNTACKPSKTWTVDEINTDENASLRSIIKAIAEITGTIAYINADDKLVFRGLTTVEYPPEGAQDPIPGYFNYEYVMDNSLFYEEDDITTQEITGIAHRNELNDTTYATGSVVGPDCIVLFDNPFLSKLSELDKETILTNVFTHITTTYISYNLTHLGNPALELGDPIKFGSTSNTIYYYLQETLEYNGGLKATGGWEYAEQDPTDLPPTSVSQDNIITRATVDKVNHRIELVTGETNNQAYIKIEAINNNPTQVTINANKIDMSGVVNFLNGSTGPGYATKTGLAQSNYTQINGGNIRTGNIQSVGYTPPAQDEHYSNVGSEFDLSNGKITTPYFYTGPSGAGFKGDISASTGTISGNRIDTDSLYLTHIGAQAGQVDIEVAPSSNLVLNGNAIKFEGATDQIEISTDTNHNVNIYTNGHIQLQSDTNISGDLNVPNGNVTTQFYETPTSRPNSGDGLYIWVCRRDSTDPQHISYTYEWLKWPYA